MKRILCLALLAAICCALPFAFCGAAACAETVPAASTDYKNDPIYLFAKQFVEACPTRSGEIAEKAAADWLKTRFDELLPETSPSAIDRVSGYDRAVFNLSCKLDNPNTDRRIIIGAHYDAVSGSNGVGDNAFGVAALYTLLKTFATGSRFVPYDLVFVAFGGEELGLVGSYGYVNGMSEADKQRTALMINLDSLVFGDKLYLYCENKSTDIADLFKSHVDGIAEKPYRKGVMTNGYDMYGYGYYETIQGSDHTPFRLAGIPVAFFFSGNYDGMAYAESANANRCVMNTSSDNFASLDNFVGAEAVARTNAVVSGIAATFADSDFAAVCDNAVNQLVNLNLVYTRLYPKLVALGLSLVCLLLLVPYYRKLQKRAIMGTAEAKTSRVFSQPDAEDIFTFDK